MGHAKAIDLVYDLAQQKTRFTEKALFRLYRMLQAEPVSNVREPAGGEEKRTELNCGCGGWKTGDF
jgi:hypothetical protein